jgi:hypothetical protein
MHSGRRRAVLLCVLYGVLSAVFCAPLFSRPEGLGFYDWDQHVFYYGAVLKSVVEYGQPPFWNPWYCGGNVLWQNPQVAILSPVYPLTGMMSLPLAMKVNIVLHYWVGFIGMHLLLTRAIGLSFLPLVLYLASMVTLAGAPAQHLAVGHSWILPAFYLPLQLFFFLRALQSGAVRHVLLAAALMALMVYNGGLHIVTMSVAAIGVFAVVAATLQRRWRPLMLAALLCVAGLSYAAPKLLPVSLFVTGEQFVDPRTGEGPDRRPDRMSAEMLWHTYLDQRRGLRFEPQRHRWHEYGNYIGGLAALLFVASVVWILAYKGVRERWLGVALAITSLVLLSLSAGEFSVLAPASLVRHLPFFSSFRIPSRYTVVFVLFAAVTIGWAVRAASAESVLMGRWRGLAAIVCLLASFDLVARNRAPFERVFSQPPLDSTFRLLKGPTAIVTDGDSRPSRPNSPMVRALMSDRAFYNCYESLQLIHTSDPRNPLVFTDGKSKLFESTFSPNRIEFAVIGGNEPSRILFNQNYAPGWRSTLGPVTVDPQYGKPAVALARSQVGRFAFVFAPPGLALGMALLALAIAGSAVAWKWTPDRSEAPRSQIHPTGGH